MYIFIIAPVLKYVKAVSSAFTPTKGSDRAAGYDLKSIFNTVVPARGKTIINTGLKFELPEGCYGRIAPRSGLTISKSIDVGGINCYNYNLFYVKF